MGSLVNGFLIKFLPDCCFNWIPFLKNIKEEKREIREKKSALDKLSTMKSRKSRIPIQASKSNIKK
jgi:hypothetical protein